MAMTGTVKFYNGERGPKTGAGAGTVLAHHCLALCELQHAPIFVFDPLVEV
jgi:hypothetical protein